MNKSEKYFLNCEKPKKMHPNESGDFEVLYSRGI